MGDSNIRKRTIEQGIRPAVVTVSDSGETAHIHIDRAVASRLAVLLDAQDRPGITLRDGLLNLRDELDGALTATAQPAALSNRRLVPYFGSKEEPS